MKKFNILFALLALLTITTSCSDDFDIRTDNCETTILGESRYVDLEFGHNNFEETTITTRATSDGQMEWRIMNAYVLIFKGDGGDTELAKNTKVYGKYFDIKNKRSAKNDVLSKEEEAWWVEMATPDTNGNDYKLDENGYKKVLVPTHGVIRIKTPTGNNFRIYVIANTDAAYLQISPEILDGIQSERDFQNYTLKLNGEPTLRTNMLMIGHVYNAKIKPVGKTQAEITDNTGNEVKFNETEGQNHALELKRMDAKVKVCIHINNLKNDRIKKFIPQSWQVMNLPKSAKMMELLADSHHPELTKENYYNTLPVIFEKTESVTIKEGTETAIVPNNIFSFYMLENHPDHTGKGTANNYHERDLRRKNPDGTYAEGEMWVNAPETATYLKIVGQLEMTAKEANEVTGKPQVLFADVVYYVHLGDFAKDVNNYKIERNTRYTYNISIVDVNSIIVEVETSQTETVKEDQTGATGDIYVAKEAVKLFDAHYGQHVFRFDAKYVDDKLTWYVKTPFTPNGGNPSDVGVSGLDYKWVKFFRNKIRNNTTYSQRNRWYPGDNYTPASGYEGDRLMNVDEFVKYIKDQKHKLDAGQPNDFKKETVNIQGKDEEHDVIYMTIFVDEYVYERNPISGEMDDGYLWTKTVNACGDRLLHILCDNLNSKDRESSITNSVVTIRQYPIQTPYTQNHMQDGGKPISAWGCETIDESGVDYSTGEGQLSYDTSNLVVSDDENGLYNTYQLLGLDKEENRDWSKYLDITKGTNETNTIDWELPMSYGDSEKTPLGTKKDNIHFLNKRYQDLRYTFLLRNRDNNGNGRIDDDEMRWYVASLNQLTMLYLGGKGLSADAQIYPQKLSNLGDGTINGHIAQLWRQHIISSTVNTKSKVGTKPQILWAEEGVSISLYGEEWEWKQTGVNSIRCIRNLGNKSFKPYDVNSKPSNLIVKAKVGNVWRFDLRRMARISIRGGGDIDPNLSTLPVADENSPYSLLPLGFEVDLSKRYAPNAWFNTVSKYESALRNYDPKHFGKGQAIETYDYLKYVYDSGLEEDYPGIKGYRLPNIREIALIVAECNDDFTGEYFMVPTYYSFGFYGSGQETKAEGKRRTWYAKKGHITIDPQDSKTFQFIRDWNPQ